MGFLCHKQITVFPLHPGEDNIPGMMFQKFKSGILADVLEHLFKVAVLDAINLDDNLSFSLFGDKDIAFFANLEGGLQLIKDVSADKLKDVSIGEFVKDAAEGLKTLLMGESNHTLREMTCFYIIFAQDLHKERASL